MDFLQNFLDYTLFEYKTFQLTIFSILSIAGIFMGTQLFLGISKRALGRKLSQRAISDPGRRTALMQIIKYLAYTIAIVFSLDAVGFNLSILLTGSAALLVGIGFGLQNTFNDFISGVIILFDASIEVGDIVQIGDLVGKIKKIGLRATTVDTREAISVIVPNSKLTQENVINWSHENDQARFEVCVGVAYGSDVNKVRNCLYQAAINRPDVLKDPEPKVRFVDFGDSALIFEVLFWTEDTFNVEFTKSDIRVAIDEAFRKHGIQIPFPQRDLHLISDNRSNYIDEVF